MHTKISSGKEHRRHRARRASVLLVVLALLFTMLPTGLYTVADAAPAEEEPALVPAPEEALPEPEDSMTKEEETDEQPAEAQPAEDKARAAAATVECYAARDGIWYPVTTVQTTAQYTDGSGKLRYYITAAELEEVYSVYGFKAANYHGERFFPHTDSYDPNKMWAGAAPIKSEDGGWQIPLSHRTEIRLYYLPANKEGAESYFLDKKELSNETLLAENMFYTVTVEDDLNRVYQEPPAPKIAFHGENVSITLNTVSSMAWDAMDGLTGTHLELEPTKQTETSVTYTIEKISQPVVFYPHTDTLVIKYEAEPDGWQHKIGQFEPSVQAPQQSAMVKGKKTLLVEPGDGDYTLLAPDIDRIEVKLTSEKANNRSLFYSFLGWRVANITEEVLLQPGTKLTAADLQHYTGSDGEVTLRAKWSGEDKLKRPITTHFFLHLNGEIRGSVDDGVQWEDQKDYTPALYTIRMLGADNIPAEYSNKKCGGCGKAAGSAGNQWRQCLRGG